MDLELRTLGAALIPLGALLMLWVARWGYDTSKLSPALQRRGKWLLVFRQRAGFTPWGWRSWWLGYLLLVAGTLSLIVSFWVRSPGSNA